MPGPKAFELGAASASGTNAAIDASVVAAKTAPSAMRERNTGQRPPGLLGFAHPPPTPVVCPARPRRATTPRSVPIAHCCDQSLPRHDLQLGDVSLDGF